MKSNNFSEVISPFNGIFLDLSEVPDPVFAEKMVGDGYAIDPISNQLRAPIAGKIIQLHKAKHAITIESQSGQQFLLHIGIDTVKLNGEGFTTHVEVGDEVKLGDLLIEFDMDYLSLHATSLITPILLLGSEKDSCVQSKKKPGEVISNGDGFFQYKEKSISTEASSSSLYIESEKILIKNSTGLHARPSAQIAALAKTFSSQVFLIKNTKQANAKSLVSILSLEVEQDDYISIKASGNDKEEALKSIKHFLTIQLSSHASESTEKMAKSPTQIKKPKSNKPGEYSGVCASAGIALGSVYQLDKVQFNIEKTKADPLKEKTLFIEAIADAKFDLEDLKKQFISRNTSGADNANIFTAHQEILDDPILIDETIEMISAENNAPYAWHTVYTKISHELAALENEMLAARGNDINDIGERVLKKLLNIDESTHELNDIPPNTVLIAANLTPSETAKLDKNKIQGIVTVNGGSTSHVAILARSLGIPAIAGANKDVLKILNETEVIIDATEGVLQTQITLEEKEAVKKEQERSALQNNKDLEQAHLLAKTLDDVHIEVTANIASAKDAIQAEKLGCDGVGLLRSEFLFLDKNQAPSLKEQQDVYQNILTTLNNQKSKPLIIRTLDVGGDKPLSYLPIDPEDNPFLGERGIRVSLENQDIFKEQIQAILSITPLDQVHIMFPMVSSLEELLEAKKIIKEEQDKLGIEKVSIGIMVEVPAAALLAHVFAPHVDFFSIGANDLTQYTMAIDRGHPKLAKKVDGLHPAVLRLIEMSCIAAKKEGIWVGVCGGIASDIQAVPILIGLGVKELSVSIPMIPKVKASIRTFSLKQCQDLAQKALMLNDSREVRNLNTL